MPTFDIVSEVDMQEVRNAVDQANREAATRFDFKNTDSAIELGDDELVLHSSTEDRLRALHQVLEEKLVKRQVSLKALEDGKIEEAQKGTARQKIAIRAGISSDHAKRLNKFIKDLGPQGRLLADPGRPAPGDRQEARRPPGGDRRLQGRGLRHPPAVRQLPGLTGQAARARGRRRSRPTLRGLGDSSEFSADSSAVRCSSNSSSSTLNMRLKTRSLTTQKMANETKLATRTRSVSSAWSA